MTRRSLFQLLFGAVAARWIQRPLRRRGWFVKQYESANDKRKLPTWDQIHQIHTVTEFDPDQKLEQMAAWGMTVEKYNAEDFQPGGKHYAYRSPKS